MYPCIIKCACCILQNGVNRRTVINNSYLATYACSMTTTQHQKEKSGEQFIYVTLPHEMSRNVPDGRFCVIFSESKFCAIYNGENHFQIRGLAAELHVFEYGGTTFGTFEKSCFKC